MSSCLGKPKEFKLENNVTEKVDYNERFYWNSPWAQGRIGFGPFGMTQICMIVMQ